MQTASVKQLREELKNRTPKELMDLCLRLSRFKKENKELLTYLLFEAADEEEYIAGIKLEMDEAFGEVKTTSYYWMNKSFRKILRRIKTYIRYSSNKETEVELLLYFCRKLLQFPIKNDLRISNLYQKQIDFIKKKIAKLHEDLQYDYGVELEELAF